MAQARHDERAGLQRRKFCFTCHNDTGKPGGLIGKPDSRCSVQRGIRSEEPIRRQYSLETAISQIGKHQLHFTGRWKQTFHFEAMQRSLIVNAVETALNKVFIELLSAGMKQ